MQSGLRVSNSAAFHASVRGNPHRTSTQCCDKCLKLLKMNWTIRERKSPCCNSQSWNLRPIGRSNSQCPNSRLNSWVNLMESEFCWLHVWLAPYLLKSAFSVAGNVSIHLSSVGGPSVLSSTVRSVGRIAVSNRIRMWSNKSLDHTTRKKDFAAAAATATGQFSTQGANINVQHVNMYEFTQESIVFQHVPSRFQPKLTDAVATCNVKETDRDSWWLLFSSRSRQSNPTTWFIFHSFETASTLQIEFG